jgi:hypothetical protein
MRHGRLLFRALLMLGPGILCSAQSSKANDWSLPDARLGTRTAPLLLLTRHEVQADLKLEPGQISGAQAIIEQLTRRGFALKGKTGAGVISERRAIDEAQTEWLGTNLSGNQLERLRQIDLWWEGPPAMISRPTVADYLKLSPEQRQALARLITEHNTLHSKGAVTLSATEAFHAKALSILTGNQKVLWQNLLGTPCRFAFTGPASKTRDEAAQRAGHARQSR